MSVGATRNFLPLFTPHPSLPGRSSISELIEAAKTKAKAEYRLMHQMNPEVIETAKDEGLEAEEMEEHYASEFKSNPLLQMKKQADAYLAKAVTPLEHAQMVLYVLEVYSNFSTNCDANQWSNVSEDYDWLMPWIHKNMAKSTLELCGCGELFGVSNAQPPKPEVVDLTAEEAEEAPVVYATFVPAVEAAESLEEQLSGGKRAREE